MDPVVPTFLGGRDHARPLTHDLIVPRCSVGMVEGDVVVEHRTLEGLRSQSVALAHPQGGAALAQSDRCGREAQAHLVDLPEAGRQRQNSLTTAKSSRRGRHRTDRTRDPCPERQSQHDRKAEQEATDRHKDHDRAAQGRLQGARRHADADEPSGDARSVVGKENLLALDVAAGDRALIAAQGQDRCPPVFRRTDRDCASAR